MIKKFISYVLVLALGMGFGAWLVNVRWHSDMDDLKESWRKRNAEYEFTKEQVDKYVPSLEWQIEHLERELEERTRIIMEALEGESR